VSYVEPPTLAEVRDWCKVSAGAITDVQLGHILGAEIEQQGEVCDVAPDPTGQGLIPEWSYQALLRRCARQMAARGIPLGVSSDSEHGSSSLPAFDGEISRIEGPYRLMAAG
jgi:hypothetical protein